MCFMDFLKKRSNDIVQSFSSKKTWEEKYKHIIEWGKKLAPLSSEEKKDKYLVRGCQSQVWLLSHLNKEKKIIFRGESDALITQGLLSLVLYFYSNTFPQEILKATPDFIQEIDLIQNLSPLRRGGLGALIHQIQKEAQVYQLTSESK